MPKFHIPTIGNSWNNSKTVPISLYFVVFEHGFIYISAIFTVVNTCGISSLFHIITSPISCMYSFPVWSPTGCVKGHELWTKSSPGDSVAVHHWSPSHTWYLEYWAENISINYSKLQLFAFNMHRSSDLLYVLFTVTHKNMVQTKGLLFSCDQAALWMVFSVRLSVRLSVCLSVCHTFFTMFSSSYHHEIFRSDYQWQKWRPCKRSRSEVKGQGHRGHNPT